VCRNDLVITIEQFVSVRPDLCLHGRLYRLLGRDLRAEVIAAALFHRMGHLDPTVSDS